MGWQWYPYSVTEKQYRHIQHFSTTIKRLGLDPVPDSEALNVEKNK
jgi:hypothetical protein